MRGARAVRRSLAGRAARAGAAAIEFALLVPVLVPVFLSLADFSIAYHAQMQLASTLSSAAEYAFNKGQSETGSTLTTDVSGFITDISPTSITPTVTYNDNDDTASDCYCVSGSPATFTGPLTCGSTCSDGSGSTAGQYVSISGQISYAPLYAVDAVVFPGSFTQTVLVRLK